MCDGAKPMVFIQYGLVFLGTSRSNHFRCINSIVNEDIGQVNRFFFHPIFIVVMVKFQQRRCLYKQCVEVVGIVRMISFRTDSQYQLCGNECNERGRNKQKKR